MIWFKLNIEYITWTVFFILICGGVVVHNVSIFIGYDVIKIVNLLGYAWDIWLFNFELLSYEAGVLTDGVYSLLFENAEKVDHVLFCDGGYLEFFYDLGFDVYGLEDVFQVLFDEVDGFYWLVVLSFQDGFFFLLLLNFVQKLDLQLSPLIVRGRSLRRVQLNLLLLLLNLLLQIVHLLRQLIHEFAHYLIVIIQVDKHLQQLLRLLLFRRIYTRLLLYSLESILYFFLFLSWKLIFIINILIIFSLLLYY